MISQEQTKRHSISVKIVLVRLMNRKEGIQVTGALPMCPEVLVMMMAGSGTLLSLSPLCSKAEGSPASRPSTTTCICELLKL